VRALALAAAANQITVIVTESLLFAPLRGAVGDRSRYLAALLGCHLCFGTWVGLALSVAFRPRWIGRRKEGAAAQTLALIADGFAIAFFGRLLNEVTAKVQREVKVLDQTVEQLEEANDGSADRGFGEPLARHP
jgi:hypothetical protein